MPNTAAVSYTYNEACTANFQNKGRWFMPCWIGRIQIGQNSGTINIYLGTVNSVTAAASPNGANGANGNNSANGADGTGANAPNRNNGATGGNRANGNNGANAQSGNNVRLRRRGLPRK
jgi:hypothetical protein